MPAGFPGMGGGMPGMGGGAGGMPGMAGLAGMMNDPEMQAAFQNPKIMAALQGMMSGNPAAMASAA